MDWANVQPGESDLRARVADATDVWVFHGPNQNVDADRFGSFGSRATPVKIARAGKNALDFLVSFYGGCIASRHPDARFVVVSNDKGYGPMLEHAAQLGFVARKTVAKTMTASKAAGTARPKSAANGPPKAPATKTAAKTPAK